MTPRQVKDELYAAARSKDAKRALRAAEEFESQQLWTSSSHWKPEQPDGSEKLIFAGKPGCCAICNLEFGPGEEIRWRSRVDCHKHCWDKKFTSSRRKH